MASGVECMIGRVLEVDKITDELLFGYIPDTFTLKKHVAVLPDVSVALHCTLVSPTRKTYAGVTLSVANSPRAQQVGLI